jgi:chromosome segregation ATPase
MTPSSDLTAKYDEERARAHELSQLTYLQGQIDDIRRLIKDQNSKYSWVIEQTRKTESVVAQIQSMFDRLREENAQAIERSRRDIVELRKEVANAMLKIDEGVKPLREMQSQIQQLAEARRQDRDQVFPWFARIESLEGHIPNLHNQIKEGEDRHRQLAVQLERLRDADAVSMQEARRVGEELQVEKNNLRRQIVETQQLITGWEDNLKAHGSRIDRVEDLHDHIKLISETLPVQITELAEKIAVTETEIKRVELVSNDWFMMNQERLEELRHMSYERISELQEVDQQHLTQITSWLERLDSWVRELEQRLMRGIANLENVQHVHREQFGELERRELHVIRELSEAVQKQFAFVQAAQVENRREED